MPPAKSTPQRIPPRSGIGLRAEHYRDLLERRPPLAFVEVHSENYFGAGGAPHYFLEQARAHYLISLHGVGLSLGSSDPLDREHLRRRSRPDAYGITLGDAEDDKRARLGGVR